MEPEELKRIEEMATALYSSGFEDEREEARKILGALQNDVQYIEQCLYILQHSSNEYALMVGSQCLLALVTNFWNAIGIVKSVELSHLILTLLGARGPGFPDFFHKTLGLCLARVTKLGWNDADQHRDVLNMTKDFLGSPTNDLALIALNFLNALVSDMGTCSKNQTNAKHRKICSHFRDNALKQIFQLCMHSFKSAVELKGQGANLERFRESAVELAISCLHFDFMNTDPDDSEEEASTIQVPVSWRDVFQDPNLIPLFFDFFDACCEDSVGSEDCANTLELIRTAASCRRALFQDGKRAVFLYHILHGMISISTRHMEALDQNQLHNSPLCDDTTLHNFCRLLCQVKRNYRLSEILVTEGYEHFLECMARFTVATMQRWRWLVKSMNYVIGFWSKLVIDLPYINKQASCHSFFKAFIPELVEAIINARVDSVPDMVQNNEDALGDFFVEGDRDNELRFTPVMYRYQYATTRDFLQKKFFPLFSEYKTLVLENKLQHAAQQADFETQQSMFVELKVLETQLACFLYYLGAALGGNTRASSSSSSASASGAMGDGQTETDIDSDLASWYFRLNDVIAARIEQTENSNFTKSPELELSKVHFLKRFSDSFLAQVARSSGYNQPYSNSQARNFYLLLSEKLNRGQDAILDQDAILGHIVDTIVTNLAVWVEHEQVLTESVAMLTTLTSEYGTVNAMVNFDSVAQLLRNHQELAFLNVMQYETLHCDFYASLAKLAFRPRHIDNFLLFMQPLTGIFEQIMQTPNLRDVTVKQMGIQLCGFLRGIVSSASSSQTYVAFFDWIYPQYLPILSRLLETWYDEPAVTTAVLRFYSDFVQNRSHRIDFGKLSANSVRLFQEVSRVINLYTTRISVLDIDSKAATSGDSMYEYRLQGLAYSLTMLTRILSGMYVNFGVMRYYEDKALPVALNKGMTLIMSIPLAQALEYDDVSFAYFGFIEVLCAYHQDVLAELESPALFGLISSLHEGLTGFQMTNSNLCAGALDYLFTYRINEDAKPVKSKTFLMLEEHFQKPSCLILLNEILSAMFSMILFENAKNYWSLARSMCTLIICHRSCFEEYQTYLVEKQPTPEARMRLRGLFEELVKGVSMDSASTTNKEVFCHNVAKFAAEVVKFCVPPG